MERKLRFDVTSSNIEMDNLYLQIAARAHKQMERYRERMRRGGDRFFPREQIGNAAVCIVFSAFAVEYSVKRLVHVRLYLQAHGERRTKMVAEMSRRKRRRGGLKRNFAFVRRYSHVPHLLLREAWSVFEHRHSLAHSDIEGTVIPESDGTETRQVNFHVFGTEILDVATRCLDTAEQTVPALRLAITEPGWNPFGH